MPGRLKNRWREFRGAPPGTRFQRRYERRHGSGGGGLSRFLSLGAGIALLAAGIFLLPAPGPGTLILLVGAGLIAQEWRWAAQALDWLEVHIRSAIEWARGVWSRSTLPIRGVIILAALALAGLFAFGTYQLFFGR